MSLPFPDAALLCWVVLVALAGLFVGLPALCCLCGRTFGICPECVNCLGGCFGRILRKCFCCAKKHNAGNNIFLRPFTPDPPEIAALTKRKDDSDDEHVPEFLRVPFDASVLKCRSGGKKQDRENPFWDAVYIGSGPSGLSGASMLSQLGRKVLVLEKSERAGGMLQTFRQDGFQFGTGLHWTVTTFPTWPMWKFATEGRAKFSPMVSPTRFSPRSPYETIYFDEPQSDICVSEKDRVELHIGLDRTKAYFVQRFPSCKKGLETFFSDVVSAQKERAVMMLLRFVVPPCLRPLVEFLFRTFLGYRSIRLRHIMASDYFRKLFPTSPTLRAALAGPICMYGGAFEDLSAYFVVFVYGALCVGDLSPEYIGKVYPVGGPGALATAMGQSIIKHGGQIFVHADVKRILIDGDNRAYGVRMADGSEIFAKNVVPACGLLNTNDLLPKPFKLSPKLLVPATTHLGHFLHCYMGFDREWDELGLPESDFFLVRGKSEDLEKGMAEGVNATEATMAFVGNPNSVHSQPGKTVLSLLVQSPYENWKRWEHRRIKQRGPEYEDAKKELASPWQDLLFRKFPKLERHLVHEDFATCLSSKHWTNWPTGETYGARNNRDRLIEMWDTCIRPLNKAIDGLTMASADAWLYPSVTSAVFAGMLSARMITGRDLFGELTRGPVEEMRKVLGPIDVDSFQKERSQ